MLAHFLGEFSVLVEFLQSPPRPDHARYRKSGYLKPFLRSYDTGIECLCRFSSSGIQEVLIQRVISSINALAVAFSALESGAVHSVYKGMAHSIMVSGFPATIIPCQNGLRTAVYT